MLYNGSDVIRDLEWVIFDEVHYINDAEVSLLSYPGFEGHVWCCLYVILFLKYLGYFVIAIDMYRSNIDDGMGLIGQDESLYLNFCFRMNSLHYVVNITAF